MSRWFYPGLWLYCIRRHVIPDPEGRHCDGPLGLSSVPARAVDAPCQIGLLCGEIQCVLNVTTMDGDKASV